MDYVKGRDGKKAVPISFVDKNQDFKTVYVEARETPQLVRSTAAQDLAEQIVGFCSVCHMQAQMTFPGGFETSTLDKTLHGKAVKVWCPKCEKLTEFLPAEKYQNHPLVMRNQRLGKS